jgi:Tol biopolymer transport system component
MLLCQVLGGPTKTDLWLWPTTGDKKPVPFLQTEFDETEGQFSPDGKKVAYVSNETGRHEVYVQPAPPTGAKWQVSNAGGRQPRWRRDGKELFYLGADQRLMVVEVRGGATFEAGTPRALFATRMPAPNPNFVHLYDVSADGRRFLVNTQAGEAAQTPVSVVVNWQARVGK